MPYPAILLYLHSTSGETDDGGRKCTRFKHRMIYQYHVLKTEFYSMITFIDKNKNLLYIIINVDIFFIFVGDTVQLNSGGSVMTVEAVYKNEVTYVWFNNNI
ncbi:MAG TPA: DUF2158 domain-containing protein [Caldithrix sp.]|nr:DUF2158 domain-containing protein [Caldithrix sp.]